MHLADFPGHVRWREGHLQTCGEALAIDFVDVVHPDGHPRALVGGFIAIALKGSGICAFAATALPSQAEKNLTFA